MCDVVDSQQPQQLLLSARACLGDRFEVDGRELVGNTYAFVHEQPVEVFPRQGMDLANSGEMLALQYLSSARPCGAGTRPALESDGTNAAAETTT